MQNLENLRIDYEEKTKQVIELENSKADLQK